MGHRDQPKPKVLVNSVPVHMDSSFRVRHLSGVGSAYWDPFFSVDSWKYFSLIFMPTFFFSKTALILVGGKLSVTHQNR
jgi:hypothetical protein